MEIVKILNIKIHKIGVTELIDDIIASIKARKKRKIFHLNVHAFNIAFKNLDFKNIINSGDIVFCDGFGVKIGAKILGQTIGERMTPPDWIDDLCIALVKNNCSLFLLGDENGVAEKCADKLHEKHPELKICGSYHGFFKKEGEENVEVIKLINSVNPDVLLVGFGMPIQERWIMDNVENLNAKAFISVGAMFRWIAGVEKRAPSFLSSNGFEGVWRLLTQPRKVWRRYLIEVPCFFFKVLFEASLGKLRN
jgi:N-acetylglucosaminyldiphosphoundecaprenol N-acetyl-beta-D-mannosaminyltransferase